MKFSILNSNLWLLPFSFSVDNQKRLSRFVKLAKKLAPDIITLQEVWLKSDIEYLKRAMSSYYLSFSGSLFYNLAGLVTLTKKKPQAVDLSFFKITHQYSLTEKLAKKGYLKVRLSKKKAGFLLINTHLYSPWEKREEKIAESQFESLKRDMIGERQVILAGDLNIDFDLFERLNKGFFHQSRNLTNTVSDKNKYRHIRLNKKRRSNKKPDYVLVRCKGKEEPLINCTVVKKPLVSDHYPIFAKIRF